MVLALKAGCHWTNNNNSVCTVPAQCVLYTSILVFKVQRNSVTHTHARSQAVPTWWEIPTWNILNVHVRWVAGASQQPTLPNENFLNYLVIVHHNIIIINKVEKLLSTDSTVRACACVPIYFMFCVRWCAWCALCSTKSHCSSVVSSSIYKIKFNNIFVFVIVQAKLKRFSTNCPYTAP